VKHGTSEKKRETSLRFFLKHGLCNCAEVIGGRGRKNVQRKKKGGVRGYRLVKNKPAYKLCRKLWITEQPGKTHPLVHQNQEH